MSTTITATQNSLARGYEGQVPGGQASGNVQGMVVDQTAGINAGRAVVRATGNAERGVSLVTVGASGEVFGFTRSSMGQPLSFTGDSAAGPTDPFADGEAVAVQKRGRIFVASEDVATAGGQVFVRADGTADDGRVRTDADGGDAVAATGWFFKTSSSGSDNICEIERL